MAKKKSKKDPEKQAGLPCRTRKQPKWTKRISSAKQERDQGASFDGEEDVGERHGRPRCSLRESTNKKASRIDPTAYAEIPKPSSQQLSKRYFNALRVTLRKERRSSSLCGEYYDGIENVVLDHLFKYDLAKQEWKCLCLRIHHHRHRCAHSAVYYW
jgi:hypothetical protein